MARRLVLIHGSATERIALKALLAPARYAVRTAATLEAAEAILAQTPSDLILVDAAVLSADPDAVLGRLRAAAGGERLPVIGLADGPAPEMRLAAVRAGAEDCVHRPFGGGWLLARIRSALRNSETRLELARRTAAAAEAGFAEDAAAFAGPGRAALVAEPGEGPIGRLPAIRRALGQPLTLLRPGEALDPSPDRPAPEALLLAMGPAPEATLSLLSELRSHGPTRHAGIVVLHPPALREAAAQALDLGASDLCEAAAAPAEIAARLDIQIRRKREGDRLRESIDRGLRLAATDPLTGLYNRRYALNHMADLTARSRAAGGGLTAMAIDLDHFKSVNDGHGHAAGDAVLVEVARRLRDDLRAGDLVARLGGEEFLVVTRDEDTATAHALAERLRMRIAGLPVTLPCGASLTVTASIGVAVTAPPPAPSDLIDRADLALYAAKRAGRDRVRLWPGPEAPHAATDAA
ncbi:diguanylate cyclase [Rhodobacteraceae bacterium CCMM004]|nr:diguanylate cyclase [Rhodobacteraceae bacterium CCMM004]